MRYYYVKSSFFVSKMIQKVFASLTHFVTFPPSIFNFPSSLFRFSFFSAPFSLFSWPLSRNSPVRSFWGALWPCPPPPPACYTTGLHDCKDCLELSLNDVQTLQWYCASICYTVLMLTYISASHNYQTRQASTAD